MKTSFKELMANALLSVVEQTTEKERTGKKEKGAEPKFSPATINLLKSVYTNVSSGSAQLIAAVVKDLTGSDELELAITGDGGRFPIFCAVFLEEDKSSHRHKGKTVIIVNSKNSNFLGQDGGTSWVFKAQDKPRLATAEEAVGLVKELTDAQWAIIMSNAIFEGIRKAAMDAPIMLVEESK